MADSTEPRFKLIGPIDASGLAFHKATEDVLWKRLTNVVARDGVLRTRPGLTPVGPSNQDYTNGPAPIIAITETTQYVNERSLAAERLAPDVTSAVTSWTGTHLDVDEDPPDNGGTILTSSTDGATITLGFESPSATYKVFDDVWMYVRARSPNNGINNLVITYPSTAAVIETLVLANGAYEDLLEATEPNWLDFFIPIPTAASGAIWTQALVNTFTAKFTLDSGTSPGTGFLEPNAGTDDDFDNGTGWLRTDSTPNSPLTWFMDWETITSGGAGDRVSWVSDALSATSKLSSVTALNIRAAVGTSDGALAVVQLYHKGTDAVRRDIGSEVTITSQMPNGSGDWMNPNKGIQLVASGDIATNPETSVAWTLSELKAGVEFGVEVVSGNISFSGGEVVFYGPMTTANVEIDNVQLFVSGRNFVNANASDTLAKWRGRIMATPNGFQRLLQESPQAGESLADILGAETAPTGGSRPMDVATFFDRAYFGNGIDLPYFYEGVTIGNLSAGTPIGKSIWSFGQRLMQCDMLDAGVRTPKRVAYSGVAGPDDWTTTDDAGDFDLTMGGEGRARKGLALSQAVAAVYLDKGIYTIRWTGDDNAPFVPSIIDTDTGIVAPATCLAVQDDGGTATHLFLGQGPQGLNVYAFNGSATQPIGNEIQRELERLSAPEQRDFAFAGLDPVGNYYILFIAETGQVWPEQAWVYDIASGQWYRWELPFAVTCAGQWTLNGLTSYGQPIAGNGTKQLILGTAIGIPYKLDYDITSDLLTPRGDDLDDFGLDTEFAFNVDQPGSPYEQRIDFDIQTGDFTYSQGGLVQLSAVKRIWLTYQDYGRVDFELSVSTDGGETYLSNTVIEDYLGGGGPGDFVDGPLRLREKVVDVPLPTAGRTHSIRIRHAPTLDATLTSRQLLRVTKIIVEFEELGDLP